MMWKKSHLDVGPCRPIFSCSLHVVVILAIATSLGKVQADPCPTDIFDPAKPTDGICGTACIPRGGNITCEKTKDIYTCSCMGNGTLTTRKKQSDGTTTIFSACNSNGFGKDEVCSECAEGLTPYKCQAKYLGIMKDPIDYCLCASEGVEFCPSTYTNTKEYISREIGFCVQTCPDVAAAPGYKCGTAIDPDKNTTGPIIACPCEEKIGDLQNHTKTIGYNPDFGDFGFNFTYFTAVTCTGIDGDSACKGACTNLASDPKFSTPYNCRAYKYGTFTGSGILADDGTKKASFCACGGPHDPPPKMVMPQMAAS